MKKFLGVHSHGPRAAPRAPDLEIFSRASPTTRRPCSRARFDQRWHFDRVRACRKYPAEQPTAYPLLEVREGPPYLPSPTTNHNPICVTQRPTDEPRSSHKYTLNYLVHTKRCWASGCRHPTVDTAPAPVPPGTAFLLQVMGPRSSP